jgi:hypothetical protein
MSPKAIEALKWIRDNKHHAGEWLPKDSKPEKCTHMKLSGYGVSIKVKSDNWSELKGFIEYTTQDRLFYPNKDGLELLEEVE